MDEVKAPTTVYFDGSCPLCTREIAVYQNRNAGELCFVDVSADGYQASPDLDQETAMARFHVRRGDGELLDGGAAFVELWQKTPGFKWLGSLFASSAMMKIANKSYDAFLVVRPAIQWMFGKRTK